MRHETRLVCAYGSSTGARRLQRALEPEVADLTDDRTRTELSRSERRLEVTVEATDLVALRAALNTWLSLLEVAERTADVV